MLAPDEVERLADASIDLVVANSLVQYIAPAELDRLLAIWRRLLAPGGVLIVADVIPPGVGVLTDAVALLRYAAKNGFLLAAVVGIGRTDLLALSPAAREARHLLLRRGGVPGQARGRRFRSRAPSLQSGAQSGPHDVSCRQEVMVCQPVIVCQPEAGADARTSLTRRGHGAGRDDGLRFSCEVALPWPVILV